MNHLRTEIAESIINDIDNLIRTNYIKDEQRNLYKFSSEINSILRGIYRIKNELESGMFFIATSGGLKSGKSTLINLLSHFNVSVTKQGQETTLRPSIIFSGDESKILTFTLKNSNISEEKKGDIFDVCIDYIKGFDKSNINKILSENDIEIKFYQLKDSALEIFLTKSNLGTIKEPFLVGIQLDEKELEKYKYNLLNKKVAFIDTPGIDGIISSVEGQNNKSESKNNWLMQRVDLMLFLQSSIAPINATSKNYIDNLVSSLESPSLKLVHNQFTLKSWRQEKLGMKYDDQSDDDAIQKAKKILSQAINQTDIDSFKVDFAKAEDGFSFPNADLLKESKFEEFELNLFTIIKDNRTKIHEEKIFQNLKKIIKVNTTHDEEAKKITIIHVENMLNKIKDAIENEKNFYINYLDLIRDFFSKTDEIKYYIANEKLDTQELDDGWALDKTVEELKSRDWSQELNFRVNSKVDDIQNALMESNNKIDQKIKNQLKNNKFNSFLDNCYVNKELKIKDVRNRINKSLDSITIKPFLFSHDESKIKTLDITQEDVYSKSFLNKLYNFKLESEDINSINLSYNKITKERIDKVVNHYKNYLNDEIDDQFSKYIEYIDNEKTKITNYFNSKYKDELEQIQNSFNLLRKLRVFFDKLDKNVL